MRNPILDEIDALSAYGLSNMADCGALDALDSVGASMLARVRDEVTSKIEDGVFTFAEGHGDDYEVIHEIADNAPAVYTHARWQEFVDLCAYDQECDTGEWPADLFQLAGVALYQIAERLCVALVDRWRQGWQCPVCGEVNAEYGCDPDDCANPAGPLVSLVAERLADQAAQAARDAQALADAQADPLYALVVNASDDSGETPTQAFMRRMREANEAEAAERKTRRSWLASVGTVALVLGSVGLVVWGIWSVLS